MPKGKIILGGNHAGLGGRLKTIAWGKALAFFSNLDYKFIWPLSDACGGNTLNPARDLVSNVDFYTPATPWITHNDWMSYPASKKQSVRSKAMQSYAAEFISHNTDCEIAFDFSQDSKEPLKNFSEKYGVTLQYKGAGVVLPHKHIALLYDRYIYELQNLNPADEILSRINNFLDKYKFSTSIGVHVRRGDIEEHGKKLKGLMKRYVHEEQYFNALDNINETTYSNIFLCTESKKVLNAFQERYGPKVIHQPLVSNHRGSVEGVQDAYVEILLLSRCQYIMGGNSNFSELAAIIGGIDVHLLNKE